MNSRVNVGRAVSQCYCVNEYKPYFLLPVVLLVGGIWSAGSSSRSKYGNILVTPKETLQS